MKFNYEYVYWYNFLKKFNIKIGISCGDGDPTNIPIYGATHSLGGISINYQSSDFDIPYIIFSSAADAFFIFGPYSIDKYRESMILSEHLIISGFVTDFAFKATKDRALRLRRSLTDKGAEFIISYFDESSSDERMSMITNEMSAGIYKALLERVVKDERLGLICKPKKPTTLRNRLKSILPLIDEAIATGRCVFMDEGSYVSSAYPCEAAQASDIAIGLMMGGTTVLESYLCGVPAVFLDTERLYSYERHKKGKDVYVFDNMDAIFDKIELIRNKKASMGEFSRIEEAMAGKDIFRDGLANERIGSYIETLLKSFDEGKGRREALEMANSLYEKRWGRGTVIPRERSYGKT